MSTNKAENHEYLKRFFNEQIFFLGNEELQYNAWNNATGTLFGLQMGLAYADWVAIRDYNENFNLKTAQLKILKNLFDMIDEFIWKEDYPFNPSTPKEHRALFHNPEWKKIQRYARQVYRDIYPEIKEKC